MPQSESLFKRPDKRKLSLEAFMQISVQFSLYPLKQEKLSPTIESACKILEERGLAFQKGGMSTVVTGKAEDVY